MRGGVQATVVRGRLKLEVTKKPAPERAGSLLCGPDGIRTRGLGLDRAACWASYTTGPGNEDEL